MWLFIFNCFFFNLQRNTTRRKPSILFRKKIKSISINLSYRSGQWQKKEKVRYPTHLFQQKHILIWFVQFQQKKNKKNFLITNTQAFQPNHTIRIFFLNGKKINHAFHFQNDNFQYDNSQLQWMNEWMNGVAKIRRKCSINRSNTHTQTNTWWIYFSFFVQSDDIIIIIISNRTNEMPSQVKNDNLSLSLTLLFYRW